MPIEGSSSDCRGCHLTESPDCPGVAAGPAFSVFEVTTARRFGHPPGRDDTPKKTPADPSAGVPVFPVAIKTRPGYTLSVSTSDFTAASDLSINACSSALSLNSMIFSTPFAPSTHGTPTK